MHPNDLGQPPRSNIHAYADWIAANLGLSLRDLPQWDAVAELRLVANAVKHAEGESEQELRQLRPDLFVHPVAVVGPERQRVQGGPGGATHQGVGRGRLTAVLTSETRAC